MNPDEEVMDGPDDGSIEDEHEAMERAAAAPADPLLALRELAGKATAGDWGCEPYSYDEDGKPELWAVYGADRKMVATYCNERDAAFIAACRTGVPALLARLDAAEALCREAARLADQHAALLMEKPYHAGPNGEAVGQAIDLANRLRAASAGGAEEGA